MHDSRGRSRLFLLVYAGAALIVVLFALFARGFSRDIGDGRVSGRYALLPIFQSAVPENLTLTWNGFVLHFSRSTSPALKGYEPAPDKSADLVFDGGARLHFSSGADTGGSITVSSAGGTAGAAGSALVVPFTVTGALQDPPPGAALAWRRSGRTYLLTLPPAARADVAAGTLTMPLSGAAWSGVLQVQGVAAAVRTVSTGVPAKAQPSPLPDPASMPSEDRLQASLASYADAAYLGWSASRYRPTDGQWLLADGTNGFSEDIGVGLLAEAITRGTWQQMLALWSKAAAQQEARSPQAGLPAATSAYTGGLRDFAKVQQDRSRQMLAQARTLLERSDNQALLVRGMVTLLADHGDADLLEKMSAFLAGRTPASLDLTSATGLVDDLLEYVQVVQSNETILRGLKEAVDHRLLPAVRTTDAGVFLETETGRSDVGTSVLCGGLLLHAGPLVDSPLATAVGRGLITSALALSDEKGFLPARLVLAGSRVSSREGSLAPESIYPMLPLSLFVPRETPLAGKLGTARWVWTSARVASAAGNASGAVLVFSYPAGVPYHLMIQGLRPFTLLKLHGIPWHADPSYFKYSDGWTYDTASQTLFMKVTGKSDREEIDISW